MRPGCLSIIVKARMDGGSICKAASWGVAKEANIQGNLRLCLKLRQWGSLSQIEKTEKNHCPFEDVSDSEDSINQGKFILLWRRLKTDRKRKDSQEKEEKLCSKRERRINEPEFLEFPAVKSEKGTTFPTSDEEKEDPSHPTYSNERYGPRREDSLRYYYTEGEDMKVLQRREKEQKKEPRVTC